MTRVVNGHHYQRLDCAAQNKVLCGLVGAPFLALDKRSSAIKDILAILQIEDRILTGWRLS
jgi:hypothetical protein